MVIPWLVDPAGVQHTAAVSSVLLLVVTMSLAQRPLSMTVMLQPTQVIPTRRLP